MKTSARNVFRCTVDRIEEGPINAEVVMRLGDDIWLTAIVTHRSVAELNLRPGTEVLALIKSSFILLTTEEEAFRASARNRLSGVVQSREDGLVNSEIAIAIGGANTLTAIITKKSADNLGLGVGDRASALVKASHILLLVEE